MAKKSTKNTVSVTAKADFKKGFYGIKDIAIKAKKSEGYQGYELKVYSLEDNHELYISELSVDAINFFKAHHFIPYFKAKKLYDTKATADTLAVLKADVLAIKSGEKSEKPKRATKAKAEPKAEKTKRATTKKVANPFDAFAKSLSAEQRELLMAALTK